MQLAPSTEDMESWRTAHLCAAIWNVQIWKNTARGSTPRYRKPYEFMTQFGDTPDPRPAPTRRQTWQEQWAILKEHVIQYFGKPKEGT